MYFTDKMTNFARKIMDKVFRHRASWLNYAGIIVVAGGAVWAFCCWSALGIMAGIVLVAACVLMVDRTVNTRYVVTEDGWLVVCRGRFSRPLRLRIGDITGIERLRAGLFPVDYVLVRYGLDHVVSVQPAGIAAFMAELESRLKECV
ncbi:putative uncharacterized protein [Prevotella sp. CAG:1124]|nr:putative uncharacterized protein [Prevotella sp. CAG:1124]